MKTGRLGFALTLSSLTLALPVASATEPSIPTAADVEKRVESILARMTLEEKIDYIGGVDRFYVRANDHLKLPALKMADGPLGVRNYGPATAFAAGISLAATWDTDLATRVGAMIGRDARARGIHIMLGPAVNIYRAPLCGRNFEYLGEDPFLASRVAVAYIRGMQAQGVAATVKHFIANNSEFDRHNTSSDIDERTMREIYLPAFEAAVKEGQVGAVMSAYNLVNGIHMTQHDYLTNQVLKKEWGFSGIVMSDWDATYDGVAAANAGLDLEMPSGKFMNRTTLLPAIKEGKVSPAIIDDKVRRILRQAVQRGWLDRAQSDPDWPAYGVAGRALALETARASLVLLKNAGKLLPLDRKAIKSVAVIGPDAYPAIPGGGGSAQVRPFAPVSILQGMADYLAGDAVVRYSRGLVPLSEIFDTTTWTDLVGEYFSNNTLLGPPTLKRHEDRINFSDRPSTWPIATSGGFSARWTARFLPTSTGAYRFVVSGYGVDQYRVYLDDKLVIDRSTSTQPLLAKTITLRAGQTYAVRLEYVHTDRNARFGFGVRASDQMLDPQVRTLAARADVALVSVGFDPVTEGEGHDRTFELPWGQDELVAAVRAANPKTVVAVTSGGGLDMSAWVDRVPAIVETWYPGQEGGTALAELLFGAFSPSGKLPASFERRFEDSAVYRTYYPQQGKRVAYREGVFVGYRHFDKSGTKPLFPFGHGLSYTTFKYGALHIEPAVPGANAAVTVSFDLTNSGEREGSEIVQVYVGEPHPAVPRPPKELKGFVKVSLKPGETKRTQVTLDRRAFSYYDDQKKGWQVNPGPFDVLVASSSQKIELRGTVTLR